MKRTLFGLLIFLLVVAVHGARAQEVLVLSATGASVVEGDVVGFETPLEIDGQGRIGLLLPTGEELILEGPFLGPLGKAPTLTAPRNLGTLRQMLSPDYSVDSVGAVRARLEKRGESACRRRSWKPEPR